MTRKQNSTLAEDTGICAGVVLIVLLQVNNVRRKAQRDPVSRITYLELLHRIKFQFKQKIVSADICMRYRNRKIRNTVFG